MSHYDSIADRYDEFVRTSVIHRVAIPSLLSLAGPAGGRVLDVGCGQGVLARAFARRGDRVVGVDISAALVDLARLDGPGIDFVVGDATTLADFADASFDGAGTCLTFGDVDDVHGMLTAIHRVLVPGGWFVAAALHPCFEPPHARTESDDDGRLRRHVNGYFEEGRWRSRNPDSLIGTRHHRRLSTILNALVETGFIVERVDEPAGTGEVLEESPIYGEVAEVLVVRSVRQSSVS